MAHPYRGPQPTPDDKPAPEPHNDQDIDTAGTEADGRPVEVPGDKNSHDIVGPTGEEMPNQTHAGVQSPSRRKTH